MTSRYDEMTSRFDGMTSRDALRLLMSSFTHLTTIQLFEIQFSALNPI